MAVDSAGNVYLTGISAGNAVNDVVTVKFNAEGTKQWVSRYNNHLANSADYARGIAVDSAGSVYVGGYTYGAGSQQDFLALKYDANGNQKWVFTYDQTGGPDFLYDFALGASGDIFLTGSADFLNAGNDILTLKLEQQAVSGFPKSFQDRKTSKSSPVSPMSRSQSRSNRRLRSRTSGVSTDSILPVPPNKRTPQNSGPRAAGEYSVRVSNSVGVTATPEARLTVRVPPSVVIFTATTNRHRGPHGSYQRLPQRRSSTSFSMASQRRRSRWSNQPGPPPHRCHHQQHRLLHSCRTKCLGRFDQ